MLLVITIIACIASFCVGFKWAEHIYKGEATLMDEREDELFENKD